VWLLEKKWRLIATGILAVLTPLVGMSLYIYLQVTSEFAHVVNAEAETLLNLTEYHVEEKINSDIANAKTFADRPLLVAAIEKHDAKAISGHLKSFIENSLSVARVIVATPDGIAVAAYPDDPALNGVNLSDKDWYRGVSGNWEPYISNFFLTPAEPKRYLFSIALPVKSPGGGVIGILVLHPKEGYVEEVVGRMRIGSSFIYIVDDNGILVYHPSYVLDRIYDFSLTPAVERVKKGLAGVEKGYDSVSKQPVISAFKPMKWGWGIILQRPEKEALQPIHTIIIGLSVFTAIAVLFGVIIAFTGMELLYSISALSLRVREQEQVEKAINKQLSIELSERRLAQQKLAETLSDLERSNKELEQFAYVASHDLQEPLRKVGSFTELLERRYKEQLGPDADRYIGYIVDGAKRMSLLINDLLVFSRIGSSTIKFAMTDCNEVLEHSLADLQYLIRESNAVVTHDDLPVIMANGSQLGVVFQNLIANAIKFRGHEPPRIHVSARRSDSGWIVSVSDNGIGIEPEFFERIFVMFQRLHTKEQYPGTGIGLAICKKVIERHGGRIWVESEFGKGAAVHFSIPDNMKEESE
jgi:signal transduction histidine kinase